VAGFFFSVINNLSVFKKKTAIGLAAPAKSLSLPPQNWGQQFF
jgi:hypothetical protein